MGTNLLCMSQIESGSTFIHKLLRQCNFAPNLYTKKIILQLYPPTLSCSQPQEMLQQPMVTTPRVSPHLRTILKELPLGATTRQQTKMFLDIVEPAKINLLSIYTHPHTSESLISYFNVRSLVQKLITIKFLVPSITEILLFVLSSPGCIQTFQIDSEISIQGYSVINQTATDTEVVYSFMLNLCLFIPLFSNAPPILSGSLHLFHVQSMAPA